MALGAPQSHSVLGFNLPLGIKILYLPVLVYDYFMERDKKSLDILSKTEILKLMPQFEGKPEDLDTFYDIIKLFPKKKALFVIETLMQKRYF